MVCTISTDAVAPENPLVSQLRYESEQYVFRLKKDHLPGVIIFFVFLFTSFSAAHATEYYALRLAGSDCTLCHRNARTGELNEAGIQFQENGHRFPLVWRGALYYFLWVLALLICVLGCLRRYRLWQVGRSTWNGDRLRERWRSLFLYGLAHGRILRNPFPGLGHLLMFGPIFIVALLVGLILLQEYLFSPLLGFRFIGPVTYPLLRLSFDVSGGLTLLGVFLLAYRRYILKPKALDDQRTDALSLLLLFFMALSGFSAAGTRIQLTASPWSAWAPIASKVGAFFSSFVREEGSLRILFYGSWWLHILSSLAVIVYIPFSRLFHLLASPLNIFHRNLAPKGALSKLDLEASGEFGVSRIEQFARRDLLEFDACTRCGRCQEMCPAHLTRKYLNPKQVIQDLKKAMEGSFREPNGAELVGPVISEEVIWECTTCRNCLEHCPVFIEPMSKLIEFRRHLVLNKGKIPRETHNAFRSIERKGNPWGLDPRKRMVWLKDKEVRHVAAGDSVDVLFWVGCYGSYDDRNMQVASSFLHILKKAGVDFGVLGNAEWCCGIDLRRMGSEYLFQVTVERNIDVLKWIHFERMVTTCPHCYNTLKNEYPQFGAQWEISHASAFVEELLRRGKLPLRSQDDVKKVTLHDSCYLGRYNDGFEPPRTILKALADVSLFEMGRNREKSFCCGGGGCHMWMEEKAGIRINETRVKEARQTGAEILATACPLCLIYLDSAVKVLNLDERMKVMDVLELVKERMEP